MPETYPSFFERLKDFLGLEKPSGEPMIAPFGLKELPDGRLRFLTISTNNAEDRIGETLWADAHREYMAWAEKENGYPELWPWHLAGQRLGIVDWMDFDGNFLLSSGLIDKGMEEKALAWASDPETAMSHGFFKRQIGKDIINYRQFEQSVLPRWAAANPYTDFTVGAKEMALTPQKRASLAEKGYSEAEIATLEQATDDFRTRMAKMGVSVKDLADEGAPASEPPGGPDPAPDPAPTPDPPAPVTGFSLDDIRSVVREEFASASKELTGRIDKLETDTKELGEDQETKMARMWEARRNAPPPSQQSTNVTTALGTKEDEEASKAAWINGMPIFQHPAFQMGGVPRGNGAGGN